MAKITWDAAGTHLYETGVDHGVLYLLDATGKYANGVAWNGLTGVSESPSGANANPIYADNIKYLNLIGTEEYACTIEAYSSPEEFDECDGSAEIAEGIIIGQQERKTFGFCYRTLVGNDTESNKHGYKLHLVYGCKAAPSGRNYATVSDSPEAITLSWEVNTTPVSVSNNKPTATLTIDSTRTSAENMAKIEAILYGSDAEGESGKPRLPLPDEIVSLLAAG